MSHRLRENEPGLEPEVIADITLTLRFEASSLFNLAEQLVEVHRNLGETAIIGQPVIDIKKPNQSNSIHE